MRAHAVHTKTYQTEILFAPVECPVEMTLCLGARINCAGHVAQEMTSSYGHKSHSILELMPYTNWLML